MSKKNPHLLCVLSCIFGPDFNCVYPAPKNYPAYFFCNNPKLKKEIRKKGWKYIFVDFELSQDISVSSFQSKFIKFLQIRNRSEGNFLGQFQYSLFVDHKFFIQDTHIGEILGNANKPIVIRSTPREKTTIWEEYNEANLQLRYQKFKEQTHQYIVEKINHGCSENIRICNTGLILVNLNYPECLKLMDEVYKDLKLIGTSECQIIWAMVSQNFESLIKVIPFHKIPMKWEAPRKVSLKQKFLKLRKQVFLSFSSNK